MGLLSIFQSGAKYFDKKIVPKCDYCQFGKRTKDGNRVLCEKQGLVDQNHSCRSFIYSPLKRIPVKQLNFVGSIADDDLFIESASDRAEKEEAENKAKEESKSNAEAAPETTNEPSEDAVPAETTEATAEENTPEEPAAE